MNKKTLIISISLIFAFNFSILSSLLGVEISLARQISGFLALTFLPGYSLLKMTGEEKNKSISEIIFFSVALSIAITMISGIMINLTLPILGIGKPISIIPLWITFNMLLMSLILISYLRETRLSFVKSKSPIKLQTITKVDLFFSLLPGLSLLSAYLFSYYQSNIGLLVLYIIIGATSIAFANSERLNFNTAYAIWCVGLSLLLSTVFGVSWNYIWGWDITGEYYLAHKVIEDGIWHISFYNEYNTVASVNILAPIYSILLNVKLVWVFKIIYPVIFSLVPVILFKAYESLLKSRVYASLAVLYFMFVFTFFTEMMSLARQMIAELYLALLVYTLIKRSNPVFLLLFGISLIVSHYATAYLVMYALLVMPVVFMIRQKVKDITVTKITLTYVAVFWVFVLLWYFYVGGGFQFKNLVTVGYETAFLINDLFNPYTSQGLYLIVQERHSIIQQFVKWIGLSGQVFIILGVIYTLYSLIKEKKIGNSYMEFYAISIIFFLYDVAGVILPYFANRINVTRLYHITLFFISPYLVIGFNTFMTIISRISETQFITKSALKRSLAIFLIIYFLSTSGWLYTVTGEKEIHWLNKRTDQAYWSMSEVYGGKWIATYKDSDLYAYSDIYRGLLLRALTGQELSKTIITGEKEKLKIYLPKKGYLYLGQRALKEKVIIVKDWKYRGTVKENFEVSINNPRIFRIRLKSQIVYSSDNVIIYKIAAHWNT